MSINNFLLFCHVMGAIMLFVAWSMEYKYISSLRKPKISKRAEENSADNLKKLSRFSMITMLITLGTGIWLMLRFEMHTSWMLMSMLMLLFIIVIGLTFSRMTLKHKFDPVKLYVYPACSIRLRLAMGTGIIALMVFKTATVSDSLMIILMSLAIGIIWSIPIWRMGLTIKAN